MPKNSSIIKKELAKKLIQRKSSPNDKIKMLLSNKTTSSKKEPDYFASNQPIQALNKNLIESESKQNKDGLLNIFTKIRPFFKNLRFPKFESLTSKLSKIYKKSPILKTQKAEVVFGNNFISEEVSAKKKRGFISTLFLFTTPTLALCFTFYLVFQVNNYPIKSIQPEVKDAFADVSKSSSSSLFSTAENLILEPQSTQQSSTSLKPTSSSLDISLIKQIYPLSCEAASLQMSLKFYAIDKNQDQLLENFGQSLPIVAKNINGNMVWGDPDEGFVGNVRGWFTGIKNGQTSLKNATGWGTSNVVVLKAAKIYRPDSYIINSGNVDDLIKALDNQNPVIFWHVRDDFRSKERIQYYTTTGKIVEFFQNHVNVLKGYKTLPDGTRVFSFADPYYDTYELSETDTLRIWSKMGNKAVVVK